MIYILILEFVMRITHLYLRPVFIVTAYIQDILSTILRNHESEGRVRHYLSLEIRPDYEYCPYISLIYVSVNV